MDELQAFRSSTISRVAKGAEVSAYSREPMCHSCSCVLLLPSWTSQKSSGMGRHTHTTQTRIHTTHTAHMYIHHTRTHHISHIHIPHTAHHTPTDTTHTHTTHTHHAYIQHTHTTHIHTTYSPSHARTHTHQPVQCPGTNSLGACCHLTDPPCCVLLPGSQVPELPSEPPAFLC